MKMMSFTHPQVLLDLYEFLSSAEYKGRYFDKFVIRLFWGTIDFHSRKKNTGATELLCFPYSSEYLPLCSAELKFLGELSL